MTSSSSAKRLSGPAKMMVDFGPLGVFLIAYFYGKKLTPAVGNLFGKSWQLNAGDEMFLAVGMFMPAFAIAFLYSVWQEKRVAPMLLISGAIIGVMGTLTLVLKDKTFFYMKPTLVNLLFAGLLGGGLATGKTFLKTLFDEAFQLPDQAWRTLTIRFIIFFVAMALLNEVLWRSLTVECDLSASAEAATCQGEALWVKLKIFAYTAISMLFTGLQIPFIMKHAIDGPATVKGEAGDPE